MAEIVVKGQVRFVRQEDGTYRVEFPAVFKFDDDDDRGRHERALKAAFEAGLADLKGSSGK